MSAKRQSSRSEAARDAVTGYTVIVLALLCFLVALMVVMAGVRVVIELGARSAATAPATPTTEAVQGAPSSGDGEQAPADGEGQEAPEGEGDQEAPPAEGGEGAPEGEEWQAPPEEDWGETGEEGSV